VLPSDWLSDDDGSSEEVILYDGVGRSYTDTTTTGDRVVDRNKRKASIPVRFDKWPVVVSEDHPAENLIPMSGDVCYVTKGRITEEWEVKDFEPDNDRSVLYGELNRNRHT
jgi:hypothetical protein